MRIQSLGRTALVGLLAGVFLATSPALAEEMATVRMLNVGSDGQATVFEPAIIRVAPGASADFIAEDFGHDAVAVADLIPTGAEKFVGYKNADLSVTFDQEGVYVYECTSHQGAGMIGIVVVGDAKANLAEIESKFRASASLSDKSKDKLQLLLEHVKTGS
jgi:pseudoazurin